jgi:hypothetical protein
MYPPPHMTGLKGTSKKSSDPSGHCRKSSNEVVEWVCVLFARRCNSSPPSCVPLFHLPRLPIVVCVCVCVCVRACVRACVCVRVCVCVCMCV